MANQGMKLPKRDPDLLRALRGFPPDARVYMDYSGVERVPSSHAPLGSINVDLEDGTITFSCEPGEDQAAWHTVGQIVNIWSELQDFNIVWRYAGRHWAIDDVTLLSYKGKPPEVWIVFEREIDAADPKLATCPKLGDLGVVDLGVRAYNCLRNMGFRDDDPLNELCPLIENDLLKEKNVGSQTLQEIKTEMARHGLALSNDKLPARKRLLAELEARTAAFQ